MTDILKFKTLQLHAQEASQPSTKIIPVYQNHHFEFDASFDHEKASLKQINKIIIAQRVLASLENRNILEIFKWYSN